jgi:type IV pilus assembly protein PilW
MHARHRGVSLVELMVAVTLGLVTVIVVMQVLSIYEARKRTATVGNDASISAAVGLHLLEREVRMAGAGFTGPLALACNPGTNLFFGAGAVLDGAPLAPLRIVDGGATAGGVPLPDRIRVVRSDADFGVAPVTIVQNMAAPDSNITVNNAAARFTQGDILLAGAPDGSKICTILQMSADPASTGSSLRLSHDRGPGADPPFKYNPADPGAAFTNAMRYEVGDVVVNLGRFGMRTFGVVCNDGAAPSVTNACDLVSFDAFASPANPTLAQSDSVVPQVVSLQAQYGVAPAGGQTVNQWVDATGGTWSNPTIADIRRIKAVRVALVTRGNLERDAVTPSPLVIWDAGAATELSIPLTAEEQRYRYKVLVSVIPIINVIWTGV